MPLTPSVGGRKANWPFPTSGRFSMKLPGPSLPGREVHFAFARYAQGYAGTVIRNLEDRFKPWLIEPLGQLSSFCIDASSSWHYNTSGRVSSSPQSGTIPSCGRQDVESLVLKRG